MPGYTVGPTLPAEEAPWPSMWEQDPAIDDGHKHRWESCLLAAVDESGQRRRYQVEEVIRCAVCQAPRCGDSGEDDPCMKRRHHFDCHRFLSGRSEHIGGIASTCRCGGWRPGSNGSTPQEPVR